MSTQPAPARPATKPPGTKTLLAFAGVTLIGGGNAVSIKLGLGELAPMWSGALRFCTAALLLFALTLVLRIPLPRGRALQGVLWFGLLNFALTYSFAYYALTVVSAGIAQVAIALAPLLVVLLSAAQRIEPLRRAALVGALIALAGTVVIVRGNLATQSIWPLLALLGAALSIAQAAVTIKRFPRVHPVVENAIAMGLGGLFLLLLSFALGETRAIPTEPVTLLSLGFLVLFGSMALFGLYIYVIEEWSAASAAYSILIMPVLTTIYASVLLGEAITWQFGVGAAIILAGVYIGAMHRAARPGQ